MKSQLTLVLAFVVVTSAVWAKPERVPILFGEENEPVIAIWREDWGLFSSNMGPFVVVAIWNDGKAIWSTNGVSGGPPYMTGRVDQEKLQLALDDLKEKGVFVDPSVRKTNFGPDSFCTAMYIRRQKDVFISRSWHELAEQNPGCVASASGLTSLEGKSREEYLSKEPADYRLYRAFWAYARLSIDGLVPTSGETNTTLRFKFNRKLDE